MDDLDQEPILPDRWIEALVYGPALALGVYLLLVILIARYA
jgi:hypothetical protein